MAVTALMLTNFRSYGRAKFELGPGLTLVVGPNGSGKTNLLESFYTLALTKSFRARDYALVRHGQEFFRIELTANGETLALAYQAKDGKTTKRASHDGKNSSLIGHIGKLRVCLFEPNDLNIVVGPPERRRQFLDYVLSQTDREYFKVLMAYRRVLRQRNALLGQFPVGAGRDQFFAWDLKLTELAAAIYQSRMELMDFIGGKIASQYTAIAGEKLQVAVRYLPSVKVGSSYSDSFLAALSNGLMTDLAAGFTTIGPHREDFKVSFKDGEVSSIASRGEIRTLALALKLSELEYVESSTGSRPLLLLDDVFSELDESRRQFLIGALGEYQSIITTTDIGALPKSKKTKPTIIETEVKKRVRR